MKIKSLSTLTLIGLLALTACQKPKAVVAPVVEVIDAQKDLLAAQEAENKLKEAEAARVKTEMDFKTAKDAALVNLLFELDKSTIRSEDKSTLDKIAALMNAYPKLSLQIAGHADERGTNEYNLALGNKRASSALTYLTNLGVQGTRFQTISYGKEKPTCSDGTEECMARNRRVEFLIIQ